jgi:putative flavoprotein involved in K+ transport
VAVGPAGLPHSSRIRSLVARDQFVQYLEQYAAHHRLAPRFGVEATRIDRENSHWRVQTSDGTISAPYARE